MLCLSASFSSFVCFVASIWVCFERAEEEMVKRQRVHLLALEVLIVGLVADRMEKIEYQE